MPVPPPFAVLVSWCPGPGSAKLNAIDPWAIGHTANKPKHINPRVVVIVCLLRDTKRTPPGRTIKTGEPTGARLQRCPRNHRSQLLGPKLVRFWLLMANLSSIEKGEIGRAHV